MSIIATAVRHLMAAGVTGDALIAAIEDMEVQIRAEPTPRSAGAIRQERYRDNKRNKASLVTVGDVCDAPLSLPPNENISNPPTHTPPDNTPARKGTPAKPEGVSASVWRDFGDLRKRKRAPLTETAMAGIGREAARAGWTMDAALTECVVRGWQSFKADWVKDETPRAVIGAPDPLMKSLMARQRREATPS